MPMLLRGVRWFIIKFDYGLHMSYSCNNVIHNWCFYLPFIWLWYEKGNNLYSTEKKEVSFCKNLNLLMIIIQMFLTMVLEDFSTNVTTISIRPGLQGIIKMLFQCLQQIERIDLFCVKTDFELYKHPIPLV